MDAWEFVLCSLVTLMQVHYTYNSGVSSSRVEINSLPLPLPPSLPLSLLIILSLSLPFSSWLIKKSLQAASTRQLFFLASSVSVTVWLSSSAPLFPRPSRPLSGRSSFNQLYKIASYHTLWRQWVSNSTLYCIITRKVGGLAICLHDCQINIFVKVIHFNIYAYVTISNYFVHRKELINTTLLYLVSYR